MTSFFNRFVWWEKEPMARCFPCDVNLESRWVRRGRDNLFLFWRCPKCKRKITKKASWSEARRTWEDDKKLIAQEERDYEKQKKEMGYA